MTVKQHNRYSLRTNQKTRKEDQETYPKQYQGEIEWRM